MKYHISIHISPYEIDNYQLFITQLRRNLNYIDKEIIFTPCLNLSSYFYNWEISTLTKEFFIEKFNNLNKIVSSKTNLEPLINVDTDILGGFSFKKHFLNQYKDKVDAFIWFDSDMVFPDDTLYYLINSFEVLEHPHCIITPQIPRMWDETWDVIVNEKYFNTPATHKDYFNFDGFELYSLEADKELIENSFYTKFASGWCNLLSSALFKDHIEFTSSMGHYGPDDTFIMHAVDILRQKNKDIKQFIIKNLVVTENHKYGFSPYKNLIIKNQNIKSKEQFREESERGTAEYLKTLLQ
jgi:hypothetical protein